MPEQARDLSPIVEGFGSVFTPQPLLTVSDWAALYRVLPRSGSAAPGPWRNERTPYLTEIMDVCSPQSRAKEIAFCKGTQIGAPLDVTTPIATSEGWKPLGEINPGDTVFDETGRPCMVTEVTPFFMGRTCYCIRFSDGAELISDGAHRWRVIITKTGKHRIITTDGMLELGVVRGGGSLPPGRRAKGKVIFGKSKRTGNRREWHRFAIETCHPLKMPANDNLPIGPYALGVWLGDGSNASNQITQSLEDAEDVSRMIAEEGHSAVVRDLPSRKGNAFNIHVDPLIPGIARGKQCSVFYSGLRKLGLIKNKHIPMAYLRASEADRWALLRGLMDTDGSITKVGRCEFANHDKRLIDNICELLWSLGLKPTIYHRREVREKQFHGYCAHSKEGWRISFTAYAHQPVFGLERKQLRLMPMAPRRGCSTLETFKRHIVSISPVPSVPVRCIAVDSESHLFLAGRELIPTHNTEAGTNWILYSIDMQPGPFLALQPTEGNAIKWSKQRVGPSIEVCDRLDEKIKRTVGRSAGNSLLQKDYNGGSLIISGSNSPSALASMPIANIYADEIDRYPLSVGEEGDPLQLVKQRASTFPRAKIFYTSTPTLLATSKIWTLYQESDQRAYEVPCPHCSDVPEVTNGGYFKIEFEMLKWPQGKPEEVRLYCPHCGAAIEEWRKTEMLRRGRWVARNPGHWRVGFHLSSLYSPVGWLSWADIARRFEEASSDPERRKAFTNTILGQAWEDDGESLAVEYLNRRVEEYPAAAPPGVLLLTLAVDVQSSRLEFEVRGWGKDEESWGILYGSIHGDPADLTTRDPSNPSVWQQLDELRARGFAREDGLELRVACTMIDSGGHYTDTVYAYTKARERLRVFSVKGSSTSARPIMSKPTRNTKNKCALYLVGVDKAKELIYARLRIDEPGPGYCHFPADESRGYDPAYYAGLTCERRVVHYVKGYRKLVWEKPRDARNEPLDLFVYGLAAIRQEKRNWSAIVTRYEKFRPVSRPPERPAAEAPSVTVPQMPRPVSRLPARPRPRGGISLNV